MKTVLFLFIATLLFATSPYEKKATDANKQAIQNPKIKCRTICDKKLYNEQKILEAVNFYKHSKDYKFTKKDF